MTTPTVRADIAELLHAGYGDRTIARHLTVPTSSVTRARTLLGLPKAHNGTKPTTTVEDAFWKWIKAADGEHLDWAGPRHTNGTPMLHWSRGRRSALRIAYRIANGHEPDGLAFTACAHPGCVAPKHIGDTAHATRPGHHTASTGRPPNASRDQVVALLRQGLSDRQVGNRLRTSPRRVAAIRVEEGIPPAPTVSRSFEERWASHTRAEGDHVRWTGSTQESGLPVMTVRGRTRPVRRAAFERHHGRVAVGLVRAGCGADWCVRPEHLEDQPMRDLIGAQIVAIFGGAS